jgi:hypothetical protein
VPVSATRCVACGRGRRSRDLEGAGVGLPAGTPERVDGGSDLDVRPIRIGDDVDDVATFITSLPEGRQLLADKPDNTVAAAVDALKAGFTPHAGPHGVIVNDTAWIASAHR